MLKPSLKDAQKRTRQEVLVKTNEYILNHDLKELGKNKTYYVITFYVKIMHNL